MSAARDAVPPAATLMLLDDRPDLHVLLLRRREDSAFVGGMHVFPGGGVDADDRELAFEALSPALSDAIASLRLGISHGGLAYWVAAVRETFEEAGVLLAQCAHSGRALDLSDAEDARRFRGHREAVDRGEVRLIDSLRAENLALSLDAMRYAARWITPPGMVRRYDTRFFVAPMPAGQSADHDGGEAVHAEWLRPKDALLHCASGALTMLPPTAGMLRILAGFDRAADAMRAAALAEAGPDHVVRQCGEGKAWRVLLPGDPEYATAAHAPLDAWVRVQPEGEVSPEVPGAG